MAKIYALQAPSGKILALPLFTLQEAEHWRNHLATLDRIVYVVNTQAQ